jgi:hypothetical protein
LAERRTAPAPPPPGSLRLWLIVDSVLVALGGVVWIAASAIALTAFGAPGTTVDFHAWAFVIALWSYPIWGIAPLVLAWRQRRRGQRAALLLSLIPVVIAVFSGIAFWH